MRASSLRGILDPCSRAHTCRSRADDETWDLSFWVRNLTDTFYSTTLGSVALNSGAVAGIPGAPRTLGGTLRVKF